MKEGTWNTPRKVLPNVDEECDGYGLRICLLLISASLFLVTFSTKWMQCSRLSVLVGLVWLWVFGISSCWITCLAYCYSLPLSCFFRTNIWIYASFLCFISNLFQQHSSSIPVFVFSQNNLFFCVCEVRIVCKTRVFMTGIAFLLHGYNLIIQTRCTRAFPWE